MIIASVVAMSAFSGVSQALVFGRDDREVVRSEPASAFSAIGIVYGTPEAGYATAFLVSDCYALTVQHVFGSSRSAVGRQIIFAAGVDGPTSRWSTSGARVVAEGGLERFGGQADPYGMRTADWALLRLTKCLGRSFGHVRLTSALPNETETVAMAGYPVDRPLSGGLILDPSCRVREERAGVLLHDCASLPGNSGSPLFRILAEGPQSTLEVFAMNTAGHSFQGPGADLRFPVRQYLSNYSNVAVPVCMFGHPPSSEFHCEPAPK